MPALCWRLAVWSAVSASVLAAGPAFAGAPGADELKQTETPPPGWKAASQRDEIRPTFSFEPKGGPKANGALVITAADSVGQHGWFQKGFPVTGGKCYRFQVVRKAQGVAVPRRSVVARVVWQDARGKAVLADVPGGREKEAGPIPLAEPEHPLDGETDPQGWT